jgi:hypothetical protein
VSQRNQQDMGKESVESNGYEQCEGASSVHDFVNGGAANAAIQE